jgi:hypothetical protein
MRRRHRPAAVLLLAHLAGGCGDGLDLESLRPNHAPATVLRASPPDSTDSTDARVHLAWDGSDVDGDIARFDFILVDHPAMDDSIAVHPQDPNRVVVTPPAGDDPRWTPTTALDTVLVVSADTLRRDPRPPPDSDDATIREHNRLVRLQTFERWHTFFVRAVDDRGAFDASPEYVSFNARTLAPEVDLHPPVDPTDDFLWAPASITFTWDGRDPIGDSTDRPPIASRWVLLPVRRDVRSRFVGYPESLYALPAGRSWSPWRRWDAEDGSGRSAALTGLLPIDGRGHGWYLFAVQAMDEAGAVTPVFDATTPGKTNVVRMQVTTGLGPRLVVESPFGQRVFVPRPRHVRVEAAVGQAIAFRWRADADAYGGTIESYRYGWNILDLDDPKAWTSCDCRTTAAPRVLERGTQRFYLEAIDTNGAVTRATYDITAYPVSRRRELLLVDDTDNFPDDPLDQERLEDRRWLAVIDSLRARRPFAFDPSADIYDVATTFREAPPVSKVFDYKTVVWYSKIASKGNVALRELAAFFDPFVDRNRDRVVPFNYLSTYVENGGEFWLSGSQPTTYLWTFAPYQTQLYPFNVTNWDDTVMPHPAEDSIGVHSFLWRMGAEAVDQGGGGQAPLVRSTPAHFCVGFRRADGVGANAPLRLQPERAHWAQPADTLLNPAGGRASIEIYNMPAFLAAQVPPLVPDPRVWLAAYLCTSATPADPANGRVYPQTADGQPAVLLRKASPAAVDYSRALCGFEVWRLQLASHIALADWILLQQFRLGAP